jgi:hypothetical protein
MIRPLVVVATNSRRDYLDQMIRPIVFVSIFEFFLLYYTFTILETFHFRRLWTPTIYSSVERRDNFRICVEIHGIISHLLQKMTYFEVKNHDN